MLQPVRRRTWAPKGKTPVQYNWDSHDRLSVVSAISVSPKRRRLGLYFNIYPYNICSEQVALFLKAVRRHLGRRFILVLDRYSVYRKAVRLLGQEHPNWFSVEWLPSYAPELNPVEGVWNHSKYSDLANFTPADVQHLCKELQGSLNTQKHKPELVLSYFKHAKLEL